MRIDAGISLFWIESEKFGAIRSWPLVPELNFPPTGPHGTTSKMVDDITSTGWHASILKDVHQPVQTIFSRTGWRAIAPQFVEGGVCHKGA